MILSRMSRCVLALLGAIVVSLAPGCSEDDPKATDPPPPEVPAITSIEPDSALAGVTVAILGERFGESQDSSLVLFDSEEAMAATWSATRVEAVVPDVTGMVGVRVIRDGRSSNIIPFKALEPPPPIEIRIDRLSPGRTVRGDTVLVRGAGFGETDQDGAAFFSGEAGSTIRATPVSWSDTEAVVLVPDGAIDGFVRIERGGNNASNEAPFSVAPRLISYAVDLTEIFRPKGCLSCHGGSGGLVLETPADAITGGNHGPAVIRRDSAGSIIVQKVGPNPPFGGRMPLGCDQAQVCLTDEQILIIADWIDQGARDN